MSGTVVGGTSPFQMSLVLSFWSIPLLIAPVVSFLVVVSPDFQVQILLMKCPQLFTEFLEFCSTDYYCGLHHMHLVLKRHVLLLQLRVPLTEVVDLAIPMLG